MKPEILTKIHNTLESITKKIIDNPALDAIENNTASHKFWKRFAIQRYLAAEQFEALLEAGIQKANGQEYVKIAQALHENLNDEKGIDADGRPTLLGPHSKWREDFYQALGIHNSDLKNEDTSQGTQEYNNTINKLIKQKNVLTIAGALLLLEYSIPEEFKRIKKGRDLTFPEKFVLHPKDNKEQKSKKLRAKLYIDHHIGHDATSHYPDLEKAILEYIKDDASLTDLLRGMNIIWDAKIQFYKNIIEKK